MRLITLTLVLLFIPERRAWSQDAPLAVIGESQLEAPVIHVPAHETVPWDATCMTKTHAQKVAARCIAAEETLVIIERDNVVMNKTAFWIAVPAVIAAAIAGGIAIGFAVQQGSKSP